MGTILHITPHTDWEAAQATGQYAADSLTREGFIHCSTPEQIIGVANSLYRGQTGLVLLWIAEDRVTAEVCYEDCYDTGLDFPHIYGPLNLDAVVHVVSFPPQADGSFTLPPGLVPLA